MNVKKALILCLCMCAAAFLFGENFNLTITLENVTPKGGTVFLGLHDSAEALKQKKFFKLFELSPDSQTLTIAESVPAGEYVCAVFQDQNANGQLDTNFIGIPKEPAGFSNYEGGGPPGGFKKLKFSVQSDTEITVKLLRMKGK
ncbi:DUF2141 domain-containing protein [Treponema sp. HNW]|uniref:DUF2141 domain-containing protein n=1 Tax=Treponema sp. HNW TaxID=3116654 RepID=UPI003D122188